MTEDVEFMNGFCPFREECGDKCRNSVDEHRCEYYQNLIKGRMVWLEVEDLEAHPNNPRKDLGDLTELTDSVRANGILQNLTVVPKVKEDCGAEWTEGYRVIIGHRRLAAAKRAGLEKVPCVIAQMDERQQLGIMMLENMQRSDLTNYEQAEGFQMMLNLGETVNTISEKTGLSESTIRRRVKLTEFDKDTLKKAEARGGTMKDYEKLSKIEDPERRNAVLAKVGMANFQGEYAKAMRDQNDMKYLRETAQTLRECNWAKELTPDELAPLKGSGKVDWFCNFCPWRKEKPEEPKDADDRQYYFIVYEGRQIDMYRDHIHVDPVETEAERKKRELRTELERIKGELALQEQDFRDLRECFVEDFNKFNTYDDEICSFAVQAILFRLKKPQYQGRLDLKAWSAMLNVGEENGELDEKDVNRVLFNRPKEALLFSAYYMLEDGNRQCYDIVWNGALGMWTPVKRDDPQLCLLYDCLRCLGYEWTVDEQRAIAGDSELLREAVRLIEKYQQEAGVTG